MYRAPACSPVAVFGRRAAWKRSPSTTANRSIAVSHPQTPRVVFSCSRMARWVGFSAASSEGREPRVSIAWRMTRFSARAAFVGWITRPISGLDAKKGIPSSQARRRAWAIEG